MAQPASARPLRVCFCHVRLPPRLPFDLFGFNILNVTEDGALSDDPHGEEEILYALVVNQPVELQREIAIVFLNDLVGRQGPLADVAAGRLALRNLPDLAAAADTASGEVSVDTLRFSLKHAAETLKTRAAAGGYRLEVRYRTDPLPRYDDVTRRVKLLRELYDTEGEVREAVDRSVAMIGGRPPVLRGGGREEIRGWVQQQTALMGVRQFTNQCLRDADVCGNGYLDFGFLGLDPTIRCLPPEEVQVIGTRQFQLGGGTGPPLGRVEHLRGLEQFESPYGVSAWEPILYVLQRQRVMDAAGELARLALNKQQVSEDEREHIEGVIRVAEAIQADTKERMERLLWFPRTRLPAVEGELYFKGQERMSR